MIRGSMNSDLEAIVRLTIQGPAGQQQDVDAIIDTGFNGWLTLPPALVAQLELSWQEYGRALLADGTDVVFDIYEGIILWDGQPRPIFVDEADTMPPLVGMSLLEGFELTIQVR